MATLTKSQVQTQYNRAKRLGWIPFFVDAAKTVVPMLFDAADLMALGSRETNLDPKWLTKAGDHGNGFGLLQADKRSFPEFTKGDGWKDAETGIKFGAKVLKQKWDDTQACIGKRTSFKGSNGKTYTFTGSDVGKGFQAQQVAIAAYNCGRWAHYAVSNGKPADSYSTGHDYSSDVIARAKHFRALLSADGYLKPDSAVTQTKHVELKDEPSNDPQKPTTTSPDAQPPIVPEVPETGLPDLGFSLPDLGTVRQQIPRIKTGARWIGTLSVGGIMSTTYAAFQGLPPIAIFMLGFLTAILLSGFVLLLVKYNKEVFGLVCTVLHINTDPTKGNVQLFSKGEASE